MLFSEYERKVLAELEEQLTQDSPRLARLMAAGPSSIPLKGLMLGFLAVVPGVALLLWGLEEQSVLVGILGFCLMNAAGHWISSRWRSWTPIHARSNGARHDQS